VKDECAYEDRKYERAYEDKKHVRQSLTTVEKTYLRKHLLCLVHQFLSLFAVHFLESLDFTTSLVVFIARALHSLLQLPALVPQRLFAFGKLLCQVFGFLNLINFSFVMLIVCSVIQQPKHLVASSVHRRFFIQIERRLICLAPKNLNWGSAAF